MKEKNNKINKLRFKNKNGEYFGEWEDTILKNVIKDISDGGTPSTKIGEYFDGNINWVNIEDIKEEIITTKRTLTESGFKNCSSKLWNPGDIILSTGATIGKVGITKIDIATKQGICGIKVNDNIINKYLKYWLVKNKKELLKRAQGSTIKEIRPPEIIKLKINLPPIQEQQKIADFLSSIDKELTLLKKEKKSVEEYKKGMMQKIFSQELRFKDENGEYLGEWEEKELGKYTNIKKGKQLNKSLLFKKGKYPVINGGMLPSGYFNEYNVDKNTITISEGGDSCGYVNFLKTDFWAGGHCYFLEKKDKYLYYYLKYKENDIKSLRVGSGLPNIQKKDIIKFLIKVPKSIQEQQKIADFLSSIDKKLELIDEKIEKVENFKKGIMQRLFN